MTALIINPLTKKIGKYEVIDEVGRSTMGIVYSATEPSSDRRFAIKVAYLDKLKEMGAQRFRELGNLQAGDSFGEIGYLSDAKRTAAVIASTDMSMMRLHARQGCGRYTAEIPEDIRENPDSAIIRHHRHFGPGQSGLNWGPLRSSSNAAF